MVKFNPTHKHLPTIWITIVAFRKNDSIEWVVKIDIHFHARPVALYIETGDLRHHAKHIADDAKLKKTKKIIRMLVAIFKCQQ